MDRRSSLIEPEHSSTLPDGGPRRCDAEARAAATWPPSPDPGAPAARLEGRHLGGHGVPSERRRGSVNCGEQTRLSACRQGPLPTMLRPRPQAPGVSQGAPHPYLARPVACAWGSRASCGASQPGARGARAGGAGARGGAAGLRAAAESAPRAGSREGALGGAAAGLAF